VVRVLEGERVAEVEELVLLARLVVRAVGLQQVGDRVEAGELHAVLVGVDVSDAQRDARVVRLDVVAGGVTVERDIREEQLHLAALHDARRARPLGLVAVRLVLEDLAGHALVEDEAAVGPAAVLGPLVGGDAGGAEEVADLREDVPVVEAEAAVGDQGEDDLLSVDAVLVAVLIGQRPGVPDPDLLVAHVGEVLRHCRHGERSRHRVLARGRARVRQPLELSRVGAGPLRREVVFGRVRLLGVDGGLGAGLDVGRRNGRRAGEERRAEHSHRGDAAGEKAPHALRGC
jgi:hypothetical protein